MTTSIRFYNDIRKCNARFVSLLIKITSFEFLQPITLSREKATKKGWKSKLSGVSLYALYLMILAKLSAVKDAPPTRQPSMSGMLMISLTLSGLTDPPY
jgi:hypothetical protein